jgi:hypothetical protein
MSQIALYQSVLQKLGQLSPNDLAALDTFLSQLIKQNNKEKPKKTTLKGRFVGTISKETATSLLNHVEQSRNEWENR